MPNQELFLVTDAPEGYEPEHTQGVTLYDFQVYDSRGRRKDTIRQLTADAVELLCELHDGSVVVVAPNPYAKKRYDYGWPSDIRDVLDDEQYEDYDALAEASQQWRDNAWSL